MKHKKFSMLLIFTSITLNFVVNINMYAHRVNYEASELGTIVLSTEEAEEGEIVTVEVLPAIGYALSKIDATTIIGAILSYPTATKPEMKVGCNYSYAQIAAYYSNSMMLLFGTEAEPNKYAVRMGSTLNLIGATKEFIRETIWTCTYLHSTPYRFIPATSSKSAIDLTKISDNIYAFTMPNGDVDLSVMYEKIRVTGIALNFDEYELNNVGDNVDLTANILPTDAYDRNVSWSSSDENVCIVNEGTVTAIGLGTAMVTATTADGGFTASCKITVRNNYYSVNLIDGINYITDTNESIDYLTYTRTFNNTKWQALYVPFEMTYADWQTDFEVARLNDVHQWDDDDNGTIDRTSLEVVKLKSGQTKPNTPYLIRAKSVGEKAITLTNTTLYAAKENSIDCSSVGTLFTFTGTYSGISGTDMVTNGYYAMGGGSLHQAASAANALSPYRWYMTVTDRNGNPKAIGEVKVMVFGDDTDGISPTENTEKTENTEVYDLSGRRMVMPTKKGLYIKNGKKVIIR